MDETLTAWLLNEPEPWTQYRTRVDLLEMNESEPEVQNARQAMIDHPLVRSVAADAAAWGHDPVTRHNDAGHALHKLSLLADFGLTRDDPKMAALIERILHRQASQGAFLSPIQIPMAFGGTGVPDWSWIACDAPTLLYVLLSMGCKDDPRLGKAVQHLVGQGGETGWLCAAAPELGKFRGPGRKLDPCPYATLSASRPFRSCRNGETAGKRKLAPESS